MDTSIALSTDMLAGVALTPEQRSYVDSLLRELTEARLRIQALEHDIQALKSRVGTEDANPAILTRPEFNREVARMLAFDERYGGLSSVLYFDFENLSEITKTYGNSVGQAAVRIVCDILSRQVRTSDIFGRLASNEFGVLLVRCDNVNAWKKAEILASKLEAALTEIEGHTLKPVISYGAYTFQEHEDVAGGLKNAATAVTHGA